MAESCKIAKNGQWKLDKAEECHPDDPKHEEKEQKKAKDIKRKAEEILDMHKGESCKIAKNGQWKLDSNKK